MSPAQAIEHAWQLLACDVALAERQAQEVLALLPDDARALLIIAVARRRVGDLPTSRALLERITKLRPDIVRAHRELALTLIAQGEAEAGLTTLRCAPASAEAWYEAEDACLLAGDTELAWRARAEAVRAFHTAMSPGSQDTVAAADALRYGRTDDAFSILRFRLRSTPDEPALLSLLAQVAFKRGDMNMAEHALARCLRADPDYTRARADYAAILAAQGKPHEALEQLATQRQEQWSVPVRLLAAGCCTRAGRANEAEAIAGALVRQHPAYPAVWLCHGETLRHLGRATEAEAAFRKALAYQPGFAAAWWALADLKTFRFTAAETEQLGELARQPLLPARSRAMLNYALGCALAHQSNYAGAMAAYSTGAAAQRTLLSYDSRQHRQHCRALASIFSPALLSGEPGGAEGSPVFIVGLPRSGSTLVEQILASHPDVEATLELPEIERLAASLGWSSDPACLPSYAARLASLTIAERTDLGRAYLTRARRYCSLGRLRFTDKSSGNFYHIGLIRLILPLARIVEVRKQPMAACFSAYRQLFANGQAPTYDLAELGDYFCDYTDLMAYFEERLPGNLLRLQYEELVNNTSQEIDRLLNHCGLSPSSTCARFWETQRPVSTHSAEQVRQPIQSHALDEWRHYETLLAPLASALEKAGA